MSLVCNTKGCDWISAEHRLCPRHMRPRYVEPVLGWAMGKVWALPRGWCETGTMHVVVDKGGVAGTACRSGMFGQIEGREDAAPRGHACRQCMKLTKQWLRPFDSKEAR